MARVVTHDRTLLGLGKVSLPDTRNKTTELLKHVKNLTCSTFSNNQVAGAMTAAAVAVAVAVAMAVAATTNQ